MPLARLFAIGFSAQFLSAALGEDTANVPLIALQVGKAREQRTELFIRSDIFFESVAEPRQVTVRAIQV